MTNYSGMSDMRRRRRRRRERRRRIIILSLIFAIVLALIALGVWAVIHAVNCAASGIDTGSTPTPAAGTTPSPIITEAPTPTPSATSAEIDAKLKEAEYIAAGYDYDGAIELLQAVPGYEDEPEITAAIESYEAAKADCVAVDVDKVPHIFYHSLINNPGKVFDGDEDEKGYNIYMTTISEFDKITQAMYDNGFVFVRLRDLVIQSEDEDGNVKFEKNTHLMLPKGKKAVVLSVDDLSYYHYMENDGFPDKLVVDENGDVKCHVVNDDGTESIGDFDVVPRLNTFLKEHPDGCYKGARGMIALTGYNGVFGYRTDTDYRDKEHLQPVQKEFLDKNPDFDFDAEVEQAKVVAEAVKASGWEIASHTWGHLNVKEKSLDTIKSDMSKWQERVAPIVGKTDIVIFAFGADIGTWRDYTTENEKYNYFKSIGYNFFCNVDSAPYWVQIRENYVRQGRRNLDGYLMYKSLSDNNNLEDLFHVADVFDSVRPTPITY